MNTSGGTTTDKFDYLGVKSCMDSLDNKFAEFAELLRTVNDYMNENISVDHHSAIFGILGDNIWLIGMKMHLLLVIFMKTSLYGVN